MEKYLGFVTALPLNLHFSSIGHGSSCITYFKSGFLQLYSGYNFFLICISEDFCNSYMRQSVQSDMYILGIWYPHRTCQVLERIDVWNFKKHLAQFVDSMIWVQHDYFWLYLHLFKLNFIFSDLKQLNLLSISCD